MLFNIELFLIHLAAVASPGPDNLLVITYSSGKLKKSFLIASGLSLGIALYTGLTLAGIDKFFLEYPKMFTVLQISGACYLAYLAFLLFKSSLQSKVVNFKQQKDSGLFLKALFTFLTNPKAFLYFFSVLPNFLPQQPSQQDLISIWLTVVVTSFAWFFSLGLVIGINKQLVQLQSHPYYLRFVSILFASLSVSIFSSLI